MPSMGNSILKKARAPLKNDPTMGMRIRRFLSKLIFFGGVGFLRPIFENFAPRWGNYIYRLFSK